MGGNLVRALGPRLRGSIVAGAVVLLTALAVAPGVSIGPVSAAATKDRACPEPAPPTTPTPRPTKRPTPDPGYVRGINVSAYDGSPSLVKLDRAGVAFVYARATSALDYRDPTHRRWVREARDHGMAVGSYHFFDYRASGRQQARFFVATVLAQGGFAKRLPPVLDVECFPPWGAGSRATAVREMRAFLEETFRLTGISPMLYLSRYGWREWLGDPAGFAGYRLWIACWVCGAAPGLPPGWSAWDVWQHGAWHVPGVRRRLGANVVPGPATALRALVRWGAKLADGPATADGLVRLDLSHADGVAWQASVDGGPWMAWASIAPVVEVRVGPRLGRHGIRVRRRDAAGVVSPVQSLTVRRVAAPKAQGGAERLAAPRWAAAGWAPLAWTWEPG